MQFRIVLLAIPFVFLQSGAWAANGFPSAHYCSTNSSVTICVRMSDIKNPDFSTGSAGRDIRVAAHRGVWGGNTSSKGPETGPPEGSTAALDAAVSANVFFVEIDIMRTLDNGLVVSHDYPLYRTTNDTNREHFVYNRNLHDITSLKLRRRDGSISDQNVLSGEQLLSAVSQRNLILMLDIKERTSEFVNGVCVRECHEQYFNKVNQLKTLKLFLDKAEAMNLTQYVVIKTKFSPAEIQAGFTQIDPNTGEARTESGIPLSRMQKYQWHPGFVSSRYQDNIQNVVAAIAAWPNELLLVIETTFKTGSDVQASTFQVGRSGPEYAGIFEYVKETKGLRGGFFTDEPITSKGGTDRWAHSSLKDTNTDFRSNYAFPLSFKYGGYGLYTTDNPKVWMQLND